MGTEGQTLVNHLGELRKRIIITLLAFFLFLCGSFLFIQDMYQWLIRDLDKELAVLGAK
jgi:sec-independent protein translocase protein TatC